MLYEKEKISKKKIKRRTSDIVLSPKEPFSSSHFRNLMDEKIRTRGPIIFILPSDYILSLAVSDEHK